MVSEPNGPAGGRVFFRDVKPYAVTASSDPAEDRVRAELMRASYPVPATEALRRPPEGAPEARPAQRRRKPWSQERGLER